MVTKATKYIHAAAQRVISGGTDVDWDSAYSTVTISNIDESDIFMQGDEAATFIDEINALCKRYPSLNPTIAACALAEPYTECIWG